MMFDGLERIVENRGRRFLLRVETSDAPADYRKYEELRNDIWACPDDHLAGARNLMCESYFHEGSSLFIGAFAAAPEGLPVADPDRLVGFCYGFVGVLDKALGFRDPANLRFYSQYTGVRPEFRAYGLGIPLKEFQRDVLLDRYGVSTVVCTYDPLTAVNAHRNIRRFRMEVLEYRVAPYGEYGGSLNRPDIPTDRFFMSWDLRREPREPGRGSAPAGAVDILDVEMREVPGRSGPVCLETVRGLRLEAAAGAVLVRVPGDFYRLLRETDGAEPEVRRIPLEWRLRTREAFLDLFARGWAVTDFVGPGGSEPGCAYVLRQRAEAWPERPAETESTTGIR